MSASRLFRVALPALVALLIGGIGDAGGDGTETAPSASTNAVSPLVPSPAHGTQPRGGGLVVLAGEATTTGFPLATFSGTAIDEVDVTYVHGWNTVSAAPRYHVVPCFDLLPELPGPQVFQTIVDASRSDGQGWLEEVAFELAYATAAEDSDQNGLPDYPFASLETDGTYWFSQNADLVVGAVRWDGTTGATDDSVRLVVGSPDGTGGLVLVEAPSLLANSGESAVLIVAMTNRLSDLGSFEEVQPETAETATVGDRFIAVGVVLADDSGLAPYEPDPARYRENPITVHICEQHHEASSPRNWLRQEAVLDSAVGGLGFGPSGSAWESISTSHEATPATLKVPSTCILAQMPKPFGDEQEGSTAEGAAQATDDGDASDGNSGARNAGGMAGPAETEQERNLALALAQALLAKSSLVEAWVDFSCLGETETGTETYPFKLLSSGIAALADGGTIKLKGDGEWSWSSEAPRITKPMTLEAVGGSARIGGTATAPRVAFSASPQTGPATLSVTFTNETSRGGLPLTNVLWDFGDESPVVTDFAPTHDYDTPGIYSVTLTVANALGSISEEARDLVEVYPATCTLTTSVTGGGGSVSPGTGSHTGGAVVSVTATPFADYAFSYWSGDVTGTDSTVDVTMTSDKSVAAHFVYQPPDLAVGMVTDTPPAAAEAGDSFSVAWTASNSGVFGTTVSWVDAVILSTDAHVDAEDLRLAERLITGGLGSGGSYATPVSESITIPDVAPGAYWLILHIDDGEAVTEAGMAIGNDTAEYAITILDPEMTNE